MMWRLSGWPDSLKTEVFPGLLRLVMKFEKGVDSYVA